MIHIVGLGGIGFWLTVGLARSVPHDNLTGWDHDTLSGGNGALRLPYAPHTTSKVDLLRGFLLVAMGQPNVPLLVPHRFTHYRARGLHAGDLVIDCTDMASRSRHTLWTYVQKQRAKMLRVSYDGRASTVVASTGLPLIAPVEGGYAEMPSLALSMAAGGIGAELVRRYIAKPITHFEFAISLQEVIP